jgi:RNA polymerase sigma-70 factor (ECF subfamily)
VADGPDEAGFRLAFDSHYRDVVAYAARRSTSGDADDIAAEAFSIAWRKWNSAPADAIRPWLFGIARNVLSNRNRSFRRLTRLQAKLASTSDRPISHIEYAEHQEVHEALARLQPADREIIRLHCWEDLTPSEIAIVLKCSANAAGIRLHRAKRRLAEVLATTPGGPA